MEDEAQAGPSRAIGMKQNEQQWLSGFSLLNISQL